MACRLQGLSSMSLSEIITGLKAAIAGSKRPGNESMALMNPKGFFRPVSEVLTPATNALEGVEVLIKDLKSINSDLKTMVLIQGAIDSYMASLEPRLDKLNEFKSKLRGEK